MIRSRRPYTRIERTQSNQLTTEDQYNLKYVWKDSAQVRAGKSEVCGHKMSEKKLINK